MHAGVTGRLSREAARAGARSVLHSHVSPFSLKTIGAGVSATESTFALSSSIRSSLLSETSTHSPCGCQTTSRTFTTFSRTPFTSQSRSRISNTPTASPSTSSSSSSSPSQSTSDVFGQQTRGARGRTEKKYVTECTRCLCHYHLSPFASLPHFHLTLL